jgi:nucleoside-diphosphate-sugar epimerase
MPFPLMRIFLTGATGYVGSAVLQALARGGHEVCALIRNPREATQESLLEARPVVGDLADPQSYAAAAEGCDAVVHTAFDASKRGPEVDRQAIDTFLNSAARRVSAGRPSTVVYTSAAWVLGNTSGKATEDAPLRPPPYVEWRPAHEQIVLEANRGLLKTAVVRPGIVYGGTRGIVADLVKTAANGLVRVVGDGRNHWACVHDRDLADLYVRVATNPEASGIYHATDEADERVTDIVESIVRHAKMTPDVRHVPIEEARTKMGPFADALALNQIVRCPRSKALGWAPTSHSVAGSVARLLEDFRAKHEAA